MRADQFFSKEDKALILEAVKEAELNTSGEIRVHVDNVCKNNVLDQAAIIFAKLNMHKTKQRNGVLFYLSVDDRKFAILGDAGINAKVPENFWDKVKDLVIENFKNNEFAKGLYEGILMAGKELKAYFPYQTDDVNELDDEISFGKSEKDA